MTIRTLKRTMQPSGIAGRLIVFWLVLFACLARAAHAGDVVAHGFKMAGDDTRVRLVMQFDREPDANWFLLRGPHRLVIDVAGARFAIDAEAAAARGLVTDVRYGGVSDGRGRLILSLNGPFAVEAFDILENSSSAGYRMVADLVATSAAAFEAALADQVTTTGSTRSTPKGDRVVKGNEIADRRFTIVIDPGHGGIDSGARGVSGAVEKDVTLTFAKELKEALEGLDIYRVRMTRDDDSFLRLDERVRVARQHGANLFISVHADTIRYKGVRGATVYTVSDQASDAEAAALAARENLSDELAGLSIEDENHEVSDILMDLIRRETQSFSVRFARTLVGSLSNEVELIKNPHRYAGFRVLRAPDVPSVLLELGYLSNKDDEKQLLDPEWRARAIASVMGAIRSFAGATAASGG
ncbi:N-acetylmuramoyl-L-alanine amidase [Mesorhizobium sp. Z1-4]|uniref:N-acetylmuramoyl-L-alanine amidase n=1 Tax=Mesorhizobium sp. Z1-4 TaxID=2448478 RepID=UPI000FDCBA98|nr:N-acetylmuramoyl-L-alanine amidase [Mesorhizobium sp. Z1-4]